MKRNYVVLLVLLLIVLAAGYFYRTRPGKQAAVRVPGQQYQRIVSLAPSITETLFALGLGDRVVGVTRFCRYPPAAREKKEVGGYLDPNYEAIAALQPDLVIVLPEHEKVREYLEELGLEYLVVHNRKVAEILETIVAIGGGCGAGRPARALVEKIGSRIDRIRRKTAPCGRPGVLIVIERELGSGSIRDVYVAGRNTYYDEMITYAGGSNILRDEKIPYPKINTEGLLQLDPEVVIDLIPDLQSRGLEKPEVARDWRLVPGLAAVRNGRVQVMSGDYTVIPGPRFIDFLEELARAIHPEVDWGGL